MALDTQAVQISINVVDNNSGAAIGQVTKNIQGIGAAGEGAGMRARAGMDQIGVGALSNVEKMRLMTEEAGVRLPRAMIRLAAESKIAQSVIGMIGPALIGIGTIQIGAMVFTQLIAGAKKLWDNYLSLTKAAQDYNAEVEKSRQENFGDTHSIETTRLRIDEASDAAANFRKQAEQATKQTSLWAQAIGLAYIEVPGAGGAAQFVISRMKAHGLMGQSYQEQAQADKLSHAREQEQYHAAQVLDIEVQRSIDNRLTGEAKVNALLKDRLDLNREEQRYNNEMDRIYGNPVAPGAGDAERRKKDIIARNEAAAEGGRGSGAGDSTAREIRRLQEEADEATLKGIDKLEYERKAADADWVSEHGQSAAAVAAIDRKYYAEESNLLDEQKKKIGEMGRAAAEAGQKVLDEQAQFQKRVDEMVAQSSTRGLSGYARIQADMQAELVRFNAEAQTSHGTPVYIARGQGAIRAGAAQQSGDLARRNAEETEQLEAQARSKFLSAEKQKTAAIDTEYRERLQKFQDELAAQEISQADYDRRVVAAAQLRDAEMVEAARQAREKMAGEFNSFFHSLDHPVKALADLGDKVAGQAAAALAQRMQTHFGGPGAATKTPGGMLGGVFDKIAGTPHAAASHGALGDTGAKTISLATAQISIGSASIAMGSTGINREIPGITGGGGWTGNAGGGGWSGGGGTGGAGSSSTGPSGSFGGTPAVPAYRAGGTTGAIAGGVQQGMGLFNQAKGIFGGSSGGGDTTSGSGGGAASSGLAALSGGASGGAGGSTGGMLGGGGIMGNAGGAIGGGLGLFNAFEGSGGIGGALSGAMSGMQLGMSLGGPMGAAIGAAGGAIIGAIGFGGKEKARVYWLKTIHPRIVADTLGYQQGTMDYTSAYGDMQSADADAKKALRAMGSAEGSYYDGTVHPAIIQAESKLTAEQRAGRSNYTPGTAQFASGADSISRTGLALLHERERVIPSDQNERITRALEGSADSSTRPAQSSSGWGGDIHIHAIDAKSSINWLMQNKHNVRAAMNASYGENSGGADA